MWQSSKNHVNVEYVIDWDVTSYPSEIYVFITSPYQRANVFLGRCAALSMVQQFPFNGHLTLFVCLHVAKS